MCDWGVTENGQWNPEFRGFETDLGSINGEPSGMFTKGRERKTAVEEGEVSASWVPQFTKLLEGQWVHYRPLPVRMAIEAGLA